MFTYCPENIIVLPEINSNNAFVEWEEPTATDTGSEPPIVSRTQGLASGSQFEQNQVHTITYSAHDASGNYAENCEFTIQVLGKMV